MAGKLMRQTLAIDAKTVTVYEQHVGAPMFYTFPENEKEAEKLVFRLPETNFVCIFENDWEHAFSPWHAPKLFAKGHDFSGGAAEYYDWLVRRVLPEVERTTRQPPKWRGLLGYSLAGLFALYSCYRAMDFARIGCVSGSLWFDGWTDFVRAYSPAVLPQAVYFSLGDAEYKSRNARMAQVQAATEQTVARWQQYPVPQIFEWNSGGHFDNVPERLVKAARWLAKQD